MTQPPTRTSRWVAHGLWAGPLLVFTGAVSYFLVFVRFPALRDVPWVNVPWVALGLAWGAAGAWRRWSGGPAILGKLVAGSSLLFSLAVSGLFYWYVFDYSYRVPGESPKTLALSSAPDLPLLDGEGREVRLSDFQGRKVVLVFYRGHW